MKWLLDAASWVFKKIPGDGKKTIAGIAAIALGYLFEYLGAPQPTPDQVDVIITNSQALIELARQGAVYIGEILQVFGFALTPIGIAHKGVKILEAKRVE